MHRRWERYDSTCSTAHVPRQSFLHASDEPCGPMGRAALSRSRLPGGTGFQDRFPGGLGPAENQEVPPGRRDLLAGGPHAADEVATWVDTMALPRGGITSRSPRTPHSTPAAAGRPPTPGT